MFANQQIASNNNFLLKWVTGLCVFVNLSGLFIPVLGTDGTLYASIAKTMTQNNNYLELFSQNKDWLDKPHLPFWITAMFFKVFGIAGWSYKLPGILIMLMGAVYTFHFAKRLYNNTTIALWSVIILLTAEHIIISNHDVRAEGFLTGFIIAAVYHFYRIIQSKNITHLFFGAFFTACAIMTKGMFALVPVAGAIGGHLLLKQQWKEIFNLKWIMAAVLILIFILPELYSLYYQFDLHPEKSVFGQKNVSGLRFFFWDSQFGRFFNTGPIRGKGDPSFFLHTTLWAFLPWSIILYLALGKKIKQLFSRDSANTEWYCFSGGMLTFIMFSVSKFQLPHYLNIVFPFFAIITADYIFNNVKIKTLLITQVILMVLLIAGVFVLNYLFFKNFHLPVLIGLVAGIIIVYFVTQLSKNVKEKLIVLTALGACFVNLYLNLVFYPALLKYQSGSEAAFYANINFKDIPVVTYQVYSSPFDFNINAPMILTDSTYNNIIPKGNLIYAALSDTTSIKSKGINIKPIITFPNYKVSQLKGKFLNNSTRESTLNHYGLFIVE